MYLCTSGLELEKYIVLMIVYDRAVLSIKYNMREEKKVPSTPPI